MTELERIMGMSFENSPIVKREAMRVSRGVKIVCQPHNGLAVCHKNNTFYMIKLHKTCSIFDSIFWKN